MRERLMQVRRHPHLLLATIDSAALQLLTIWYFQDPFRYSSELIVSVVVAAMLVTLNQVVIIRALQQTGVQFNFDHYFMRVVKILEFWVLLFVLAVVLILDWLRYAFLSEEDQIAEESRRSA